MGPSDREHWTPNKILSSHHLTVSEPSELMKYQYLRVSLPHDSVMMKNCNITCGNALYLSEGLHHLSKWNCRRNIINLIYSLSLLSQMGLNSITIVKIIKSFVESRFAQLILRRNIKMIFQLNQSINNKIKKNRMSFLFSDI